MKNIILLLILFAFIFISCGEKPITVSEIIPSDIKLSDDIDDNLKDSAQIIIYIDGIPVSKGLKNEFKSRKDLYLLNLPIGEHSIDVFVTGVNENVVYALDRKKVNIYPDIKNTLNIELAPPIKFDTKIINLPLNGEVIVTARVDNARLPENFKNPTIVWTIDNIEGGNHHIGLVLSNGNSATIKGPSTLPSPDDIHYLGAYYELDGKKFIGIVKIKYIE